MFAPTKLNRCEKNAKTTSKDGILNAVALAKCKIIVGKAKKEEEP
jgi:hypothetical protein